MGSSISPGSVVLWPVKAAVAFIRTSMLLIFNILGNNVVIGRFVILSLRAITLTASGWSKRLDERRLIIFIPSPYDNVFRPYDQQIELRPPYYFVRH